MFALSSVVDSDIGWPIGFLRRILPESLSSSTFGIDRQRPQVKDFPLITAAAAAAATISSRMVRKVYPEERGRDWGGAGKLESVSKPKSQACVVGRYMYK